MEVATMTPQPAVLSSANTPSRVRNNIYSTNMLEKIRTRWFRLAQVKASALDKTFKLESELPDFLPSVLPFGDHPLFEAAAPEMQERVLSFGWLMYNWKTIEIEEKIISPICNQIVHHSIPGPESASMVEVIGQTLVDEAYHILMVSRACEFTTRVRQLPRLKIPVGFSLVSSIIEEQARYTDPWEKNMVLLTTCIVSEVFISDYLKLLSSSKEIQPLNRQIVEAHRRDEFRHSPIFKNIANLVYGKLNEKQRVFFNRMLPKPVRWFANNDLMMWKSILEQIGFEGADVIIRDSLPRETENLLKIDYSELVTIAEEIGVLDSQIGRDSFAQEGLMN